METITITWKRCHGDHDYHQYLDTLHMYKAGVERPPFPCGFHPQAWNKLCAYPSIYPTIRSLIHPSTQPAIHPSTQPAIHPAIQPAIHPKAIQPSTQPAIQPSIHPTSHPTIQPSIQPAIHPTSHPAIHPTSHPSIYRKHGTGEGDKLNAVVGFLLLISRTTSKPSIF